MPCILGLTFILYVGSLSNPFIHLDSENVVDEENVQEYVSSEKEYQGENIYFYEEKRACSDIRRSVQQHY